MGKLLFGIDVLVSVDGIDNVNVDLIQSAKKELIENFKEKAEDIFCTDEFEYVYINANIAIGDEEGEDGDVPC